MMFCPLAKAVCNVADNPLARLQQGYAICEEENCAWWVPTRWFNEGSRNAFEVEGHCCIREIGRQL